ncbi:MAG: RIP metalloprotease RseP [Gammaproteobacteria bacterium TMED112]|nr:MAG: RIP metalloprotease RseP [Gammaproteobacteria bacterium TMED112]|tara:strand:+ start:3928 stop:5211 length:1284 start_codon:yes stop_codon:yes gene_type:complete
MYSLIGALTLFLILVTFHEYGHYSVARYFKIKIIKFSIGFGPDLYKWKNKDNIRFSLSAIPFGGYVAFHDPADTKNYNKLNTEEKKYVLANRPAIERSLVVLAGPIYNFILAFFVFTLVGLFIPKQSDMVSAQVVAIDNQKFYEVVAVNNKEINSVQALEVALLDLTGYTGDVNIELFDYTDQNQVYLQEDVINLKFQEGQAPSQFFGIIPFADFKPRIENVETESTAEQVGFISGDTITRINQERISSMYQATIALNKFGQQIDVEIERDGRALNIALPSKQEGTSYGLRFGPEANSLSSSIVFGYNQTVFWIKNTFKFLFKTLNGTMGIENLSGPVGIAKVAGDSLVSGLIPFLLLLGILSISLGAFNLLPLPMLDGGQFLFILVEKLKGSPISLKLKATLMNLSFLLILTLFIFVMVNDIARII